MSTDNLLAERQKTHGDFEQHAEVTQGIKMLMVKALDKNGVQLSAAAFEAIEMIAHKMGRIAAGDPTHRDHWDDIAGYARLGARTCPGPELETRLKVAEKLPRHLINVLVASLPEKYGAKEGTLQAVVSPESFTGDEFDLYAVSKPEENSGSKQCEKAPDFSWSPRSWGYELMPKGV